MSAWSLDVEASPLASSRSALVAVGVFRDQRPLRGGAGLADWRLCGWLSRLVLEEAVAGGLGERVLLPTESRLASPRLLVLGLGDRADYGAERYRERVCEAARQALGLGAASLLLHLPEPEPVEATAAALVRGLHDARGSGGAEPRPLEVRLAVEPEAATSRRYELERAAAAHPGGEVSLPRRRVRSSTGRRSAERIAAPPAPGGSGVAPGADGPPELSPSRSH